MTSLLGFSSVIPTAVVSSIDDNITRHAATTTGTTMSANNTPPNVITNVELGEKQFAVAVYTPVLGNVINETQQVQIVL